ncbi:MAG: glycosyltransferase family 2 protein [Vicinamibacterales bacterium]
MLSILTPAFNEAGNLPVLYQRLVQAMAATGLDWEWVIVDDHSRDETFAAVERLSLNDPRVRGIRLARNSGSHSAIACGLHHVRGDAAAMMAADLQNPPETLHGLVERWQRGAQVVWATRRARPGQHSNGAFATVYYWMMRSVVGMTEMPAQGTDFFLIDRAVVNAFRQFPERNVSVLALIMWLGFRQEVVEYDQQPRASGRSGWTLARKMTLVIDSVTSFSDAPIRLCSYAGIALIGVALLVVISAVVLVPSLTAGMLLMTATMIGLTGLQLLGLGMVGEYVWRALDEARRRPRYVIEATTPGVEEAATEATR